MPETAYVVLMAMHQIHVAGYGLIRPMDIATLSGFEFRYIRDKVLPVLMRVGYVDHPVASAFLVTELGKIALAIECGRKTKRLASGKNGASAQPWEHFARRNARVA